MGSEHYCLRWNNHQSNLLGVFSQLLQDESLVDVTLACSEGASIRAHKVVLSACSTYFQSLFLEHPTRHPIIILKDVRYPELRTLVDFMYKGEVNVQYCQLSALLKTAESLKVKGLAEMTNQNTALREPERDTERLRPHSATTTKSEPIDTTGNTSLPLKSSTSALSTITSPTRLDPDRCSPSSPPPPPPSSSSSTRLQTLSTTPLDLYQRKNNRDPENQLSETPPLPLNDIHYTSKEERPSSPDDDAMSNDIGINMTINSNALHTSAPPSVVVPPIPTSLPSHPTDLRPSSRGGPNSTTPSLLNTNNSSSSSRDPLLDSGSSRLTMPESLPGPSGMGPVQQVPLSLKKEIEWDRHEEKHIPSDSGISDFRHPHDTMEDPIIAGYRSSLTGQLNRFPIPFAFPFAPLSLGLFDTDPSRILNLLHHQTLLAEEALRYRGVFLGPKERYNPLADMLSKEHDNLLKRNSFQSRDPFRYQMGLPDLLPATPKSRLALNDDLLSKNLQPENKDYYNSDDLAKLRSDNALSIFATSNSERTKISQKDLIDEILMKRGGSYLKDGIRFNPMSNVADQHKEKSNTISSSLSSASSTSSYKGLPETVLINEASVTISEDESKCNTCNAVFPSTWLLEQHIALQHSSPGSSNEEKSFLCDQYRNALAKHRESQNQRSRIPADKLFTCDVCGMQFRYLKSFKKHRLNHALERIHGKNGKGSSDNNELVSSSNEMMDDNIDLNGMIKDEEEDDDQNDMIDSMTKDDHMLQHADESQTKISSSEFDEIHSAGGIHSTESIGSIKVRSPAFLQKSDVESSIPNTSLSGLLRPDTTIGLSAQDTSLINFLRNDVDKQQNKSAPVSRFACPFCGKCVRSKENLKLHVRKHTGERPFVCLFCGRAFGGKSDLTRHLRIHTGERPYHCEACGKCFARADYLSKHLTTHLHNTSR